MVTKSEKVLELQNVSRDKHYVSKTESRALQTYGGFLKNFNEVLLRTGRERITQIASQFFRNWV